MKQLNVVPVALLVLSLLFSWGALDLVQAQSTAGAASLQIPADVRSEGMGRAYAPLVRGPMAAWSNPAGLGFARGIQATGMRSQLVPSLAEDVIFRYASVLVGHSLPQQIHIGGLDVTPSATLNFNYTHLDYGESIFTDPGSPDPMGTFSSFEETLALAGAVALGDYLSAGWGWKRAHINLAPLPGPGDAEDFVTAYDYGFAAAVPLYMGEDGWTLAAPEFPDVAITPRAGIAWSNTGDDAIRLSPNFGSDPLPKTRRKAVGVDIEMLSMSRFANDTTWLGRQVRNSHALSISAALGRTQDLVVEVIPDSIAATLSKNERLGISTHRGLEVKLFDVVAARVGHHTDERGQVIGTTYGAGLSLFGYAGVDFAKIPQFRTLRRVSKWALWVRIPLG